MSGNRTWIYCRIAHGSVLGQDAIEIQRRRLEWYAAQHGLTVVGSSEDCQPGTAMDRPGVQRMNRAIEQHKLIDDVGPKTGLIVCSGCDIPFNAKYENVKAMVDAAADYLR